MMNEQLKKEQMKQKIDQLSEALTQIFTEDSEEMKLPVSTKKRKGNPDFRIEDAEEDALPLVSVMMPVCNAEQSSTSVQMRLVCKTLPRPMTV